MGISPEDLRNAALAATNANRPDEAYHLWLRLAEAGDPDAQAQVGAMLAFGMHRPEPIAEPDAGSGPGLDEATALADRDRGAEFLAAASAAGIGPASFNLATLYVTGYGGGSWEDRKARAAELFALAQAQGFNCFGNLMGGGEPGQPYFDILEGYAAASGAPLPGVQRKDEPDAAPDPARDVDSENS